MQQSSLMKFDPSSRALCPYPSYAEQWREYHGQIAWIFNPWTGMKRTPADIGSDTFGYLIIPNCESVYA